VGTDSHAGFYCVIEGISGVGKTSVAEAVIAALAKRATLHLMVEEPSEKYRRLRELIDGPARDNVAVRRSLLVADRAEQVQRLIVPALHDGKTVIAVRSYLSTAVYQSTDGASAYRIMLDHDWMPRCDLLVVLDAEVNTALSRIQGRKKKPGDFETREHLQSHRELYKELASAFPARAREVVDASAPLEDVTSRILSLIDQEWARR